MAGLDSLKSKLKRLCAETKAKPHLRSVLTESEYVEIQRTGIIPAVIDENSGWLVVPDKMTIEEWEEAYSKE